MAQQRRGVSRHSSKSLTVRPPAAPNYGTPRAGTAYLIMADVTQVQAEFAPPGIANPLGATYAHVVWSEDMQVQGMFRQVPPLFASTWAGRTGLSEPMPAPGPEWAGYAAWARRVKVDLQALHQYASAVAAETDAWIATLGDADLDRPLDLSGVGFGHKTLGT